MSFCSVRGGKGFGTEGVPIPTALAIEGVKGKNYEEWKGRRKRRVEEFRDLENHGGREPGFVSEGGNLGKKKRATLTLFYSKEKENDKSRMKKLGVSADSV